MIKILTLHLDPELMDRAEVRAERMGLDCAKYVRSLIEEDLATPPDAAKRKFASEDLIGMYEGLGTAATNAKLNACPPYFWGLHGSGHDQSKPE